MTATALRRNHPIEPVIAELRARFGDRVSTSASVREQHGNTTTWVPNQAPDAVVFPHCTEEVQMVVRLCAAALLPAWREFLLGHRNVATTPAKVKAGHCTSRASSADAA